MAGTFDEMASSNRVRQEEMGGGGGGAEAGWAEGGEQECTGRQDQLILPEGGAERKIWVVAWRMADQLAPEVDSIHLRHSTCSQ